MKKPPGPAKLPDALMPYAKWYEKMRYSQSRRMVLLRTVFLILAILATVWIVWWLDWS